MNSKGLEHIKAAIALNGIVYIPGDSKVTSLPDYMVLPVSFQDLGNQQRENVKHACEMVIQVLANYK
jgi:hypothetical protein